MSTLAEKIKAAKNVAPHLIVEALAGTGKTTTLIEGLKKITGEPVSIEPSPQQAAVWDAMMEGNKPLTICFAAFNKSIADELKRRVPVGCDASTMHGLGLKSIYANYKMQKRAVNKYRTDDIIEEVTGVAIRQLRREDGEFVRKLKVMVSKCKMNLANNPDEGEIRSLAFHYGVNLNGDAQRFFDLLPQILDRARQVDKDGVVDFDDMIWIPVVNNLPCAQYDLLLWDEAQDGNKAQQALALKTGRRLLLCGDSNQAIYGFAGADSDSLNNMAAVLGDTKAGVQRLPLTVTRRCGQNIVKEANAFVENFEAHETCPEGQVENINIEQYMQEVQPGDMVLCRTNVPLIRACFKQLRKGVRANIQGRDIGEQLVNYVKQQFKSELKGVHHTKIQSTLSAYSTGELVKRLTEYTHRMITQENEKRNPNENLIESLNDRCDCILVFAEECSNTGQVVKKIQEIFTDDGTNGILFSSGHKAKGLEADRVFILDVVPFPHPMAKQDWEITGEYNLRYVMVTRAINRLFYVSGDKDELK